jgi:hypothetical protein
MTSLRRRSLALLAAVSLAGLPACGEADVEREAGKAGEEAKKAGKKAKKAGEKAKKDVDGY